MSQNLQNLAKFQKIQQDNLVDFEKCRKTRIFLQKSMPIQPKTSNILPKFCQKLATKLVQNPRRPSAAAAAAGRMLQEQAQVAEPSAPGPGAGVLLLE